MSASAQAPSPGIIFDTLQAYQRTVALRCGIDLDLFTAIGEGNRSAGAIAARIRASEKGTRVLCDFLAVMGLLTKQGSEYGLTTDSAVFLDRRSPTYLGEIAHFLVDPQAGNLLEDITGAVKQGGAILSPESALEADSPMWVEFARSMAPMMRMGAELLAKIFAGSQPIKVLDISAGHGAWGIAFAVRNPKATVVGLDWASVLEVAKENAEKAGVAERYSTIAGSAFEMEFGSGYDIVLIPNFLHHFHPETNEKLLRKVHAALAPGGMVLAPDFIPNDDRITPARDAMFSLQMLEATPHGDAYTFAELERMFHNAGFARSELRELAPHPQRLVVSYK